MEKPDLTLIFVLVVAAFVMFSISFREDYQANASRRRAEKAGLAPTEEQLPLLQEKIGRRQRGAVIGALVGGMPAWYLTTGAPAADRYPIIAGALIAGGGVGIAVTALFLASRRPADAITVARSTSVTLSDYSSPGDRNLVRGLVALGVVTTVATAAVRPDHTPAPLGLGLAISAVVALVFFEIAARRVVALGQPAGSVTELVFNDAIRAGYVFDLLIAPITLGTFAALIGLGDLSAALGNTVAEALRQWSPLALLTFVIFSAIRGTRSDSGRHYLRRLWPDIAARAGGQLAVVTEDER